MLISNMNWPHVEEWLKRDDRAVIPLGSTEQHAGISLSTDTILAQKVSADAAEPLGIPVFPALPFGITTTFLAYPGTISLRPTTYFALLRDMLDSLHGQGFRRFAVVNGHGGNQPAAAFFVEWMSTHEAATVRMHNWWSAPKTLAKVHETDSLASHASWCENFPWTTIPGVVQPTQRKPMIDLDRLFSTNPRNARTMLGDGNFGGYYEMPDDVMHAIWDVAVAETRDFLEGPWR